MHSQSGVISLHNAFVTLDGIASSIFFNSEANHYIKGVGGWGWGGGGDIQGFFFKLG